MDENTAPKDENAEHRPSRKARALSARLSAVQALYQASQNKQPINALLDEYINHRSDMEIDGEKIVKPDSKLLKKILLGVDERQAELLSIVDANLNKDASDRKVEPLLKAIFLCGCYELMIADHDAPVIINDYINVSHAFYERSEAALVNGVMDSISKTFKS